MQTRAPAEDLKSAASRLMWFFAIVYVAQGMSQESGILHQALYYYLMDGLHWNAAQVSLYVGAFGLPWVIKPLYGLVSDCFPLFGYRRKSYLILANLSGTICLAWVSTLLAPGQIQWALLILTFGMAISSALCGALLVEYGKNTGMASKFCSQQTLWVNIAHITAAAASGWICLHYPPAQALHLAAVVAMIAPLLVVVSTFFLIKEPKVKASTAEFKQGMSSIGQALRTRSIWAVAGFLFLWNLNPGFGAPLIAYAKNQLHFTQGDIGLMFTIFAAASAVGGLLYMFVLSPRFSVRKLAGALIVCGGLMQASYVFMSDIHIAMVLQFFLGLATSMALLNAHVIAANRCPDHSEGFMYGCLLAVHNIAYFGSQAVGGWLYENLFHQDIKPLILISAALTFCCIFVLPFIDTEVKRKEELQPAAAH